MRGTTAGMLLLAGFATLAGAQGTQDMRAIGTALGRDSASRAVVEWCEARRARNAPTLRAHWQAWREANQLDALRGRLDAGQRGAMEQNFGAPFAQAIVGRLERAGNAAAACGSLDTFWQSADMDLRRQHPQLYAAAPVAAPAPALRPAPAPVAASRAPLDKSGAAATVYTPAQLHVLSLGWRQGRDYQAAMSAMRANGPLYVRGRVVRNDGDRFYIESGDERFGGRLAVSPGFDISMFEGRTITVTGDIDELPTRIVFLRKARLVRDDASLKPSTLDEQAGLYRRKVDDAQVAAAPGGGIDPGEVMGVLHHGEARTTANGRQFVEEIRLLLKDGTWYEAKSLAPDAVDKRKSRELQPQLWGRWRRAGGGFELQAQDERGRPQQWQPARGKLLPEWPANHRLDGTWTLEQFFGSDALGGTHSRTSMVFGADDRFERIRYSSSSSGSIAAQGGSGFSAGGSARSDGKGSTAVAGGGTGGGYADGASNHTWSESSSTDGSGNRGRYRLAGRTLTLIFDNGRVEQLLCAPRDGSYTNLVLNGATWSRK